MTRSKRLSFTKALAQLKETKQLNTAILAPLGFSFEHFLRYTQLPDERSKEFIELTINHFERTNKPLT